MEFVLLLVVCLRYAGGAIHSWKAFYTATTGLSDFPEFVALNLIDDQLMGYFDSNTKRFKSQFQWMEDNLGKEYDEQQTNILQAHTATFKNNIQIAMERFNQTHGVHTIQEMYGCELDDKTGSIGAFRQYGYDGQDWVTLDFKEMRYISPTQQVIITALKWNKDGAKLENDRNYFSTLCIEWLRKYLQYGKSSLEKTVSPQVSLLQKSSSSPVVCHVTGFYPSGIKISWQKNRQDHDEDVDLGELLPNENETFQKTSTLNVKPEEWQNNNFKCVVEHQGKTINSILTKDKIRTNNCSDFSASALIVIIVGIVIAVVLVLVIAVAGFVLYQKKNGFKSVPENASDSVAEKTKSQTSVNSVNDPGYGSGSDSNSDSGSYKSSNSTSDITSVGSDYTIVT